MLQVMSDRIVPFTHVECIYHFFQHYKDSLDVHKKITLCSLKVIYFTDELSLNLTVTFSD